MKFPQTFPQKVPNKVIPFAYLSIDYPWQVPKVRPHHAAHESVRLVCRQQLAVANMVSAGHAGHGAAARQSGKWAQGAPGVCVTFQLP